MGAANRAFLFRVLLSCLTFAATLQTACAQSSEAPAADAQDCAWPAHTPGSGPVPVIRARLVASADASQMKPGHGVDLKAMEAWATPACKLLPGSLIRGHIVSAVPAKKGGNTSELSMVFDRADCIGHRNTPMAMRVAAIVNQPDEVESLHTALPLEVSGGAISIGQAAGALGTAADTNLRAISDANIKEGEIRGAPNTRLEMQGGSECSTLLSAAGRNVHLEPGSEILLEFRPPPPQ